MDAWLTGHGRTRAADKALCIVVGEDLTRAYPGYAWDVGCDHEAGTVAVRLAVPVEGGMAQPGFLLHISSVVGPDGQHKVRRAGGEVLERWKLRRERAPHDWLEQARANGLDRGNMVMKSRH